ncbi:TPA: response regulator [Candidatus Galligastranaerophilus intestinavium]|uniref:Response regulator n=1 Tax=Candidatus Galligastranaerophilus intestinavium TaxID=2840836 RepID=A0A9D1JXS4_9BACT|nr:response regulator [Candidatus Galligastranaerophilus intestinavium]
MSDENVQIGRDTIDLIYKIAGTQKPEVVSDETIKIALCVIEKKLSDAESLDILPQPPEGDDSYNEEDWKRDLAAAGLGDKRKILVVDDIGVVTYQLKILFQKMGFEVDTAKDIYGAAKLIRKSIYDFIIMDLFVSTEREGFLLLDETKKVVMQNNLKTKIIVITASSKGEHKVKCLNRGANMFLQKDTGWQDELVKFISTN